MNHFRENHYVVARLDDLIAVVVAGGEERGRTSRDATIPGAQVLVRIEIVDVELALFFRRGQNWEPAVRRIDDQRSLARRGHLVAGVDERFVVVANVTGSPRTLCGGAPLARLALLLGRLGFGVERFIAQRRWTFERRGSAAE